MTSQDNQQNPQANTRTEVPLECRFTFIHLLTMMSILSIVVGLVLWALGKK